MLKLIKHDLKEHKYVFLGWLIFIVLFAIELIVTKTLVAKNIDEFTMPIVGMLTSGALMLFTFIYNIYYLYIGIFSKRAYLNLKLGLSRKLILIEKMILGFALCIISGLLGNVFTSIMAKIYESSFPNNMGLLFNPYSTFLIGETEGFDQKFLTLMVFMTILGLLVRQIDVLCSLSLGHIASNAKNLISFLVYIGINIFQGAVATIINITMIFSNIATNPGSMPEDPSTMGLYILLPGIIIQLVFIIPKLFATFWATNKKMSV